ncbi:hypothetical protein JVU11DRAFT_9184 [Chiua virens]|nr:hypothetical protein JVU11DRAFT_9184 [Chiua virens]
MNTPSSLKRTGMSTEYIPASHIRTISLKHPATPQGSPSPRSPSATRNLAGIYRPSKLSEAAKGSEGFYWAPSQHESLPPLAVDSSPATPALPGPSDLEGEGSIKHVNVEGPPSQKVPLLPLAVDSSPATPALPGPSDHEGEELEGIEHTKIDELLTAQIDSVGKIAYLTRRLMLIQEGELMRLRQEVAGNEKLANEMKGIIAQIMQFSVRLVFLYTLFAAVVIIVLLGLLFLGRNAV